MINRLWEKVIRRLTHYRALLQSKRTTLNNFDRSGGKKILVVCYGNIYRSPFVEVYLKGKLEGCDGVEIKSAGFHQKQDRKSPEQHVIMSKMFGVDLSAHSSVVVDEKLVNWADYILIMDRFNWEQLQNSYPEASDKILWLAVYLGGINREIQDPYALPQYKARKILQQLQKAADVFGERIVDKHKLN